MIRTAPARAAISFVLAPLAVLAMFVGWVAATDGLTGAVDPEGLGYLLAFTGFALPGLILALILTWFIQGRTGDFGTFMQMTLAGLAGLVVTCATFSVVLELLGGGSMLSDPLVLILPGAIGMLGCLAFVGLGGSRGVVA